MSFSFLKAEQAATPEQAQAMAQDGNEVAVRSLATVLPQSRVQAPAPK